MLKPQNNYVTAKRLKRGDQSIVQVETSDNLELEDIIIQNVSPGVTCCSPGDKVILRPRCNFLAVDDVILFDASNVLAVEVSTSISNN